MTGYLRSLAAHAVTPWPQLRPVTVPFAPVSAQQEPQEQDVEIAATTPVTNRWEMPPASTVVADRATRPSDSNARAPLTAAIVHVADPFARWRPAAAASHEPTPAVEPRANEHQPTTRREVAATEAGALPPETRQDRDRAARPIEGGRIRPAVSQHHAPSAGASRLAERRNESESVRGDAPADVHIHIGRIELTAVTAPAPSRQPPAAVKTAMPLDEYLRRRSERTR